MLTTYYSMFHKRTDIDTDSTRKYLKVIEVWSVQNEEVMAEIIC